MGVTQKMYAYMGGKTEQEKQLLAEQENIIKQMEEEAAAITRMVSGKGWKMLQKYMESRVKYLHVQMEKCSSKDLYKIQNEIKTIKSVFGFLESKIMQKAL